MRAARVRFVRTGGWSVFIGPDSTPHVSGGRLCLGIVNTVLWRRSDAPVERLTSYDDLVRYVARAGWLPGADRLMTAGAAHPRKARAVLGQAIDLRETLFRIFSDVAAQEPPPKAEMRALNRALAEAMSHVELVSSGAGGFETRWGRGEPLDVPLWQVAASAGALLASDDLERLKQCPGEQCGWVFIDVSSNQSRRWCDTKLCGNRARVRAHYERTRRAAG
jgi:predicted RNA-binding Zn ribbon-like protein